MVLPFFLSPVSSIITVIDLPFNAPNILDELCFFNSVTDQGDFAIKCSNVWPDFNPTTLAISGGDFLLIPEIIPKCKYLKLS